jgi:hypothetical protein
MKAARPSRFLCPLIIYPLSPILAKPMLAFHVLNLQTWFSTASRNGFAAHHADVFVGYWLMFTRSR